MKNSLETKPPSVYLENPGTNGTEVSLCREVMIRHVPEVCRTCPSTICPSSTTYLTVFRNDAEEVGLHEAVMELDNGRMIQLHHKPSNEKRTNYYTNISGQRAESHG